MKILAVCGMGIGSSLILKMNIDAALKGLRIEGVEVGHCDLTTARGSDADLLVATKDLAGALPADRTVLSLDSIMDKKGLAEKLAEFFANRS